MELPSNAADMTSGAPSPSRSSANTPRAPMAEEEMTRLVHVGGVEPEFSYLGT
jgi:hypothetical protein